MKFTKPKLSFWQIWNMNVGFFGIQFSFGLQQTAINPIFSFLGAHNEELPLLNLAGPVTGLIIQPLIGAISDKTWSPRWGRRKPFFLIGAIVASLCLFMFPFSSELWFAVGLLWVLDAGNNTAMEPYRAFVGDKLPDVQLTYGFQMQSLFVGAGITLANFSLFLFQDWFSVPIVEGASLCTAGNEVVSAIPTWVYYSFFLGAIMSIGTILWSVLKTPEIPPSDEELKFIRDRNKDSSFAHRVFEPFIEIYSALGKMPVLMKKLAGVYLFQWYALFVYWQFITPMLRVSMFGISNSDTQRFDGIMAACNSGAEITAADTSFAQNFQFLSEQALAQTGLMNGTYNMVTMLVALVLVPIAAKYSNKAVYVGSLFLTGIAMLSMPYIEDPYLLLLPMILFGIGWAAMMGIPYAMVSKVIPKERRGVYMGIVNMMIVIPMGIQTLTFGFIVKHFLGNSAVNAILFGGVFFIIASLLALRIKRQKEDYLTFE
ncbi:SLC45 family MFS transporter [Subsaximicrobium wynnwilliamsii]|uniref:SLC45 family MFS transporter n=1 Tax=Subsaximicrobium wynnwilliamsii TaxID=291179 RepID=A0A5C6ZH94_9FLAO|nr:MFS transporter [Subsaximicrobium wynnwilliamsii]TXD83146.1 SLC45 family MFS transporter [Subsaximicrobium wynnwilliamsii]TXD88259.1 SLC45 family MFS transporter [Subsaximicrobium wynnwilliamsii]TXE02980.1 SLC45 family MFS transporter [Subsaximicrobium wynnwilliamsii]